MLGPVISDALEAKPDPVRIAGVATSASTAEFYVKCPTTLTFKATVNVERGTGTVVYRWLRTSGFQRPVVPGDRQTVKVDGPGTITLTDEWTPGIPAGRVSQTESLEVLSPSALTSRTTTITGTCDASLPDGPPEPPPSVGAPPGT